MKSLGSVLFPGQGSQFPGMGKFLFDNFRQAQLLFEEASDALQINMKKLCFEGSEQELALTENTQPALVTVSSATWICLEEESGYQPSSFAGHSVGEYSALVAAGALAFSDAVKAVRLRGGAMQAAVPAGQGGMIAILGLDRELSAALCQTTLTEYKIRTKKIAVLSPANFNAPGQIVASGHQNAIVFLKENIKSEIYPEHLRKAKLIPLNVSAPFHCSLMAPAEKIMAEFFMRIEFSPAEIPVIQNTKAEPVTSAQELKSNLIEQVSSCVHWSSSVEKMISMGSQHFIECGPGKVLAGLGKKISSEHPVLSTSTFEDFEKVLAYLKALSHSSTQNS